MKRVRILSVVCSTVFIVALFAPVAFVQQMDPELLMKWATAEVIHYDVVAEYSAPTSILSNGSAGLPGKVSGSDRVAVKDRFEISVDAGRAHIGVVGKPAIRNFPSTVAANPFEGACRQPPPISGAYDHIEVLDYKYEVNSLVLTTKRTYPAGSVPLLNEVGVCGLHPVAARTETVIHHLPLIEGTLLAMPASGARFRVGDEDSGSAPNRLIVQPDGKTAVLDDSSRGWKYTYTLKIVKEGGGLR